MPSFPGLQEPLSDGVVSVRPSAERDIPEVLIAYQDDPGLPARLGEDRAPSGAALGRRSERAQENLEAGRCTTFTVVEMGRDVCRGEVRVDDVDWADGRAAVRVWVVPGLRGQGVGKRAHALVCRWLRAECGLTGECGGLGRAGG